MIPLLLNDICKENVYLVKEGKTNDGGYLLALLFIMNTVMLTEDKLDALILQLFYAPK